MPTLPINWLLKNFISGAAAGLDPLSLYRYNGSTQYSYTDNEASLNINQATTDFCFSANVLFRPDINAFAMGLGASTGQNGRYNIFADSVGVSRFVFTHSGGSVNYATSVDNDTDNTLHNYLCRIDITNSKYYMYLDGVLLNAGGTAFVGTFSAVNPASKFVIGAGSSDDGTVLFNADADIRDCRIYHKDITSPSDLALLVAGEEIGDEIAWWRLGDYGPEDLAGAIDLTDVATPTVVYP